MKKYAEFVKSETNLFIYIDSSDANKTQDELLLEEDNKEIGPYRVWLPDDTKGPGLAMSRSFGDFVSKEIGVSCHPDIFRFELTEYDKFLIGETREGAKYCFDLTYAVMEDIMKVYKDL